MDQLLKDTKVLEVKKETESVRGKNEMSMVRSDRRKSEMEDVGLQEEGELLSQLQLSR